MSESLEQPSNFEEIWPETHTVNLAGPEDAKRLEVILNDIIGKINEMDGRLKRIEGFLVL